MEHSDKIDQLAAALVQLQSELEAAPKNADNPYFKSRYADLNAVWNTVRKPLAKWGLAVTQIGGQSGDGTLALTTMLIHTSGQYVAGTMTLPLTKLTPQEAGSAVTYARRYGLSAILGLVTEKDDDAEGAMKRNAKPPQASDDPAPLTKDGLPF
jgi:hypothetical protein